MIASRVLGSDAAAAIAALAWMAACYCLGGLHGLVLGWTQPARMAHWAKRVEAAQLKLNELEDRADGLPTDRELRRLRRVAFGSQASQEQAGRSPRGDTRVQPHAPVQVVDQGQGPPALIVLGEN